MIAREAREREAFDTMAENYEGDLSFDRLPAKRKIERTTDAFVRYCGLGPGSRVLEIGCGSGFMTSVLAKKVPASLIGCDISLKMLQLARGGGGNHIRPDELSLLAF